METPIKIQYSTFKTASLHSSKGTPRASCIIHSVGRIVIIFTFCGNYPEAELAARFGDGQAQPKLICPY